MDELERFARENRRRSEMGRIGKGTKVWDEKGLWGDYEIGEDCVIGKFVEIGDGVKVEGLQFPTFSANCSSILSVRDPLMARLPGTVQSIAPRSNRSARR